MRSIFIILISLTFIKANIEAINQFYKVEKLTTSDHKILIKNIIAGPPNPPLGLIRITVNTSMLSSSEGVKILEVPAYNWTFGCSATAASMIAAYYDREGYPNIYRGPTNSGMMPMDNSIWPDWVDSSGYTLHQNPLSATHLGLDGRTIKGHVDDYWIEYGSIDNDPYYSNWTEHKHGYCTADFMKTNQTTKYGNADGETTFYNYVDSCIPLTSTEMENYNIHNYDGGYGFKLFFESAGYKVISQYNQAIDLNNNCISDGFTFNQYKAEIDNGRPVLINLEGHSVVGIGYNSNNQTIYLHDTWDYSTHSMSWGGSYAGMKQLSVSIIHLKPKIDSSFSIIPQLHMMLLSN